VFVCVCKHSQTSTTGGNTLRANVQNDFQTSTGVDYTLCTGTAVGGGVGAIALATLAMCNDFGADVRCLLVKFAWIGFIETRSRLLCAGVFQGVAERRDRRHVHAQYFIERGSYYNFQYLVVDHTCQQRAGI
jgi:hypothetical protein